MFSITIPLWLLITAIGIPVFSLMALIYVLVRIKYTRKHTQAQTESHLSTPRLTTNHYSVEIYKMIIDQQIDAVFLSLSTIIETEKLKLKALMGGQNFMEHISSSHMTIDSSLETCENLEIPDTETPSNAEIADSIENMAESGMTPKEIARELGLSLSEVVLALRMNHVQKELGGQLEAVA